VDGVRETNARSTLGYLKCLQAGQSPVADRERLDPERRARERLVLGLRRIRGVEKGPFAATTGYAVDALAGDAIANLVALGFLENCSERVRLTREGLFISDAIWPEML
jgi:oxygen-independent coproporphyrinogen-3 oxidase